MSLFIKTLIGEATEEKRPPVWFMRQAGRALKSYRTLKEKHNFSQLLYTPDLAAQVTQLPEKDLGIDALILFSDILVVLEGMGIQVDYESSGPKIQTPLKNYSLASISKLQLTPNPSWFDRIYQTIKLVKKQSSLPLIGFCGGPLTLFLYLFQGSGHQGNFQDALKFFYTHPQKTDEIFSLITEVSIQYAQGQIRHRIDAFQIFETWAGIVPVEFYLDRVFPWIKKLAKAIQTSVPIIFFPRLFSTGYLALKNETCFNGISIDSLTPLLSLSPSLNRFTLQGNLNSELVKYGNPEILSSYLKKYLKFYKTHPRWIFNLGHGVLPGTPEENLKAIVNTIKSFHR